MTLQQKRNTKADKLFNQKERLDNTALYHEQKRQEAVKTARLRELRLAKEAADREEAERNPPVKPKKRTRTAKKKETV